MRRRQPSRIKAIEGIAHFLQANGVNTVKSIAPGFEPPGVLEGTHRDHQPDIVAYLSGRPMIVDVITSFKPKNIRSRATLFESAARLYGGSFVLVCYDVNLYARILAWGFNPRLIRLVPQA